MHVEEEAEPGRKLVDGETAGSGGLHIGDAVRQGKRHLLDRCAARLTHVVARDGDGVPARHLLAAIVKDVSNQAHRRPRWVNPRTTSDVLLEDVVLDRSA